MHPLIDILIPTYKGFDFIIDTLESIRSQSYPNVRVLIAIDGKDDQTHLQIHNWFEGNQNISHAVFQHPKRIGWIKNVNFLLGKSNADYLAILPHDDVVLPDYYSQLYQALLSDSNAIVSFSDIQGFGLYKKRITQSTIAGSKEERVIEYLTNHYVSVLFRGLLARKRMRSLPRLRSNASNDFAADTIWGLNLVLEGNAIRIPNILYQKRYHPNNTHWKWNQWGARKKIYAWTMHCKECFDLLSREYGSTVTKELFEEAVVNRLFQSKKTLWKIPYYRIDQELRTRMKRRVFNSS